MANLWMPTYTGKKLDVLEPRPEQICLKDIAHALSNICRYAGHVGRFYSVAEHSVRLSHLVCGMVQRRALLHDAAEAYLVDMPAPVKRLQVMKPYEEVETILLRVILTKYEATCGNGPALRHLRRYDKAMLWVESEWAGLHPHPEVTPWAATADSQEEAKVLRELARTLYQTSQGVHGKEWGWEPKVAEEAFLQRAKDLCISD